MPTARAGDCGVKPRFGAVHQHGSIAIIERFFRTLKTEMLRKLGVVPLSVPEMRREIRVYLGWYHRHRPHQGMGGLTPAERGGCAAAGAAVAAEGRIEVRARYPLARAGPGPPARRVARLELVVERLGGRRHLPVVSLREAA